VTPATRHARSGVAYALPGLFALAILFPYIWILLSSLKRTIEIFAMPPTLLPQSPSWDNYLLALGVLVDTANTVSVIPQAFRNSLITASLATFIIMALAVLAAYAFGRLRFRFRAPLLVLVLALRTVPAIALIVPIYILVQHFGLLDTPWALVVVYTAVQTPFATWLLTVFVREISPELEDAARVDGCTRLGVLWRIIIPLAVPSIAVVTIFTFLNCWNDFQFAVILTQTDASKTIPVALNELQNGYEVRWGVMTAGAVLHTLPAIVVVLFAQRYVVSGMTLGAVKG
jgi:multiple sugar transport system permease protein